MKSQPVRRFVVQLHRARRRHFDFRLELNGVLASWAIPKGPTMDHRKKRLAVRVDDHALEYFDFEGVLEKGTYGAGDVTVWDWGTWEPRAPADPGSQLDAGELHFDLTGTKLSGQFVLLRSNSARFGQDSWLLIRKRDERSIEGWDANAYPHSVKTGRTNDEVAADHAL
jgi:bifunctional non-homologous end joining protein LigD